MKRNFLIVYKGYGSDFGATW